MFLNEVRQQGNQTLHYSKGQGTKLAEDAMISSDLEALNLPYPLNIINHRHSYFVNFLFGKYFYINILWKQNCEIIIKSASQNRKQILVVHLTITAGPTIWHYVSGIPLCIMAGNCFIGTTMVENHLYFSRT